MAKEGSFGQRVARGLTERYRRERREHPHLFDAEGWRIDDPYALTHPSGHAWYFTPRTPRTNETDPAYKEWFRIAKKFEDLRFDAIDVIGSHHEVPGVEAEDVAHSDAIVPYRERYAAGKNERYLREHVLPRLKLLMRTRSATAEFAMLWGEYCEVRGALKGAVDLRTRQHAAAKANSRQTQVEWYLEVRAYLEASGLTVRQSKAAFVDLVFDIVQRKRRLPPGFNISWFEKALAKRKNRHGNDEYVRDLPDALRRAKQRMRTIEAGSAEEAGRPSIPPVDPAAYPLLKK